MPEDQQGSNWNKIFRQIKDGSDEEDGNTEDENDHEVDESITAELASLSKKEDASSSLAASGSRISESVNISLQWIDKMCGITPTTKKGQNIFMAGMLVIPLIPIFALITQNVILFNDVIIRKTDLIASDGSVEQSNEVSRLVSSLQQERSETLFSLFVTNNIQSQVAVGLDLKKRFLQTDFALENMSNWRSPVGEEMFRSKLRFQIRLDDFRKLVIENNETSQNEDQSELVVEDAMYFYTYATKVLLDDISIIIRSSNGSSTWRFLITYKNILRAIESVGIEMSFGIRYQARGTLIGKNFGKFIEHHKLSLEYLQQGETFLTNMKDKLKKVKNTNDFKTYNKMYKK